MHLIYLYGSQIQLAAQQGEAFFFWRSYVHYVMSYLRSAATVSERTPELGFRM